MGDDRAGQSLGTAMSSHSAAVAVPSLSLVAAAPDLLAVAEQIVAASVSAQLDGPIARAARAAVAKARGETDEA